MVQPFKDLLERRHENAARWKQDGKKIVGYLCSYGLEEVLHAAGLQPVRVFGSGGPYGKSKEHIQPYYCQSCHGAVDEALKGSYDYLDGLIFPYTCEHARAAYDSWRVNVPVGYTRFIDMPSQTDLSQAELFFVEELKNLTRSLEDHFNVRITDENLQASIKLHNRNRALSKEIYSYKEAAEPVVSGSEVFSAIMSGTVTPKEEHNALLEEFLNELKGRKEPAGNGPRVMAIGTEIHDVRIIEAVEEAGVRLVADELCTGSRLVWENIDENEEPLKAIALHYLSGINCPVKRPSTGRMEHMENLARDYKVEGIVVLHPRHCDPNEWDMPFIKTAFTDKNIPVAVVNLGEVFSPDGITDAIRELKGKL